jgi:hypothetical protein
MPIRMTPDKERIRKKEELSEGWDQLREKARVQAEWANLAKELESLLETKFALQTRKLEAMMTDLYNKNTQEIIVQLKAIISKERERD